MTMPHEEKHHHHPPAGKRPARMHVSQQHGPDRASCMVVRPKKGGHGGKGAWGKLGDELIPYHVDVKDPNFGAEQ